MQNKKDTFICTLSFPFSVFVMPYLGANDGFFNSISPAFFKSSFCVKTKFKAQSNSAELASQSLIPL